MEGHIAFHHDVTSVRAYVTFITSLTNVSVYIQVYMQVYIHIYLQVAHNFYTFYMYATKVKFGMIFTQIKTLDFMLELPLGLMPQSRARGQNA